MSRDILRRVRFAPYGKGRGPRFALLLWDTHREGYHVGSYGKPLIGYRLTMIDGAARTVLFEGEDFGASAFGAIDADEVVRGVMGFLTLRPGDTDADYFAGYSEAQREFCEQHAEALALQVYDRYGE